MTTSQRELSGGEKESTEIYDEDFLARLFGVKDPNPPQIEGQLLVTGCPRSGTRFAAEFFQANGLDIQHERAGKHGTVEWRHAYTRKPVFQSVISLSRHPMLTIRSLTDLMIGIKTHNADKITWRYIKMMADLGHFRHHLDKEMWVEAAVEWWISVYRYHIEQGYRRVRLEDLSGDPTKPHPKPCALDFDKDWAWEAVEPIASQLGYTKTDVVPL